jgi:hypothetical protein
MWPADFQNCGMQLVRNPLGGKNIPLFRGSHSGPRYFWGGWRDGKAIDIKTYQQGTGRNQEHEDKLDIRWVPPVMFVD